MNVKTVNTAADVKTVIDIARSTCGRNTTRNSVARLVLGMESRAGRNTAMATMAATPMPATTRNVARQPNAWPSAVPAGTPMMLATVSPAKTKATALARCPGATRSAATTAAMPKKAAWAKAVNIRAPMRNS